MNWNEIGTQLIVGIVGIIVSGLGVFVTYLINKWVKDNELKTIITSLNDVVKNAVAETYQTYVEALKEQDNFTLEAQKIAVERCLETIKANMPIKVEEWLKSNYTDIEKYLKSLIEAQIGLLKNNGR